VLSLTPFQAKYIKTYPLHTSQKTTDKKDECIVELNMYVTHDFVMELLSLGSEAEVLQPKSLRTEMRNNLKAALAYYDK